MCVGTCDQDQRQAVVDRGVNAFQLQKVVAEYSKDDQNGQQHKIGRQTEKIKFFLILHVSPPD